MGAFATPATQLGHGTPSVERVVGRPAASGCVFWAMVFSGLGPVGPLVMGRARERKNSCKCRTCCVFLLHCYLPVGRGEGWNLSVRLYKVLDIMLELKSL